MLDENRFGICFSHCVNLSIRSLNRFLVKSKEVYIQYTVGQKDPIQIVGKAKLESEDDGPDRVQLCLAVDQADEAVEAVNGATWTSHPLGVNRYDAVL